MRYATINANARLQNQFKGATYDCLARERKLVSYCRDKKSLQMRYAAINANACLQDQLKGATYKSAHLGVRIFILPQEQDSVEELHLYLNTASLHHKSFTQRLTDDLRESASIFVLSRQLRSTIDSYYKKTR